MIHPNRRFTPPRLENGPGAFIGRPHDAESFRERSNDMRAILRRGSGACLDALQSLGRKVGVISHVPAMVERIGVQVKVESRGGGRSTVRILTGRD